MLDTRYRIWLYTPVRCARERKGDGAVKLVTYDAGQGPRVGALVNGEVVDVGLADAILRLESRERVFYQPLEDGKTASTGT